MTRLRQLSLSIFLGLVLAPTFVIADLGDCSQPSSSGSGPIVTDCLFILKAAVGLETCVPECVCDPDAGGSVNVTDALICLRVSVGQSTPLNCPCETATTTTTTTMAPQTLPERCAGAYVGTYSGSDSGEVTLTFVSTGSVSGEFCSTGYNYCRQLSGTVTPQGAISGGSNTNATFSGTLLENCTASGQWTGDGGGSWNAARRP